MALPKSEVKWKVLLDVFFIVKWVFDVLVILKIIDFFRLWKKLILISNLIFLVPTHANLLVNHFFAFLLHFTVEIQLYCCWFFGRLNFCVCLLWAHDNLLLYFDLNHVFLDLELLTVNNCFHVFDCGGDVKKTRAGQVFSGFLELNDEVLQGLPRRKNVCWTDWGWLRGRYFGECWWLVVDSGEISFRNWGAASQVGS